MYTQIVEGLRKTSKIRSILYPSTFIIEYVNNNICSMKHLIFSLIIVYIGCIIFSILLLLLIHP